MIQKIVRSVGILLLFLFVFSNAKAQKNTREKEAVLKVLSQQQSDWNAGNIKAFMGGYWESDSLLFVSKKGITKGWNQTYANYVKSYPDAATMGRLTFVIKELRVITKKDAMVVGSWLVSRTAPQTDVGGHFSLLFKKVKKQWVIVIDHTS